MSLILEAVSQVVRHLPFMPPAVLKYWTDSKNLPRLKRALAQALCLLDAFPVWKTIKLGTGITTGAGFRDALIRGGTELGESILPYILNHPMFEVAKQPAELDLVALTLKDLGLDCNADYLEISLRAKEVGFVRVPREGGPQLRLQYLDQPEGENLIVAMEPLPMDNGGYSAIFELGNHGRLYLRGVVATRRAHTITFKDQAKSRWVFACPRKQ